MLEYILEDHVTLAMLSGNLATDLMKVGISAIASLAAGLIAGGFTTLAAGPLVAAILVGTFSSAALDYLDTQYGLTEKLVEAIDKYGQELFKKREEIQKSLSRAPHEIERSLIWRMYKLDIDNPSGF